MTAGDLQYNNAKKGRPPLRQQRDRDQNAQIDTFPGTYQIIPRTTPPLTTSRLLLGSNKY